MHLKHSFLLATALTATSAVARLHGHQRRHTHPNVDVEAELPATTPAPELDVELKERAVGDVVTATIDGEIVTWINQWAGEVAAASSSSTETVDATPPPPPPAPTTNNPGESTAKPPPTSGSTSGSSGGNWFDTPSGAFSRAGFGASTASARTGALDWDYKGNVGNPWGSNIIEVAEADASQYKHVIRFEGSMSKAWTVLFWNTYGPTGAMDGFFTPHKALEFSIGKGEVKYVAIDENSQGGWGAAPGNSIPTNFFGQYASTWGEFDMSNAENAAHSGWDVSCIIPQLAGLEIQGMKICNHAGESCSYIGKGLVGILSAYTSADQGNPKLAVTGEPGPTRLVATLDYVH